MTEQEDRVSTNQPDHDVEASHGAEVAIGSREEAGRAILIVDGELDLYTAPTLRDRVLATVEDLRLAASELVANAVESNGTGPIRLALVTDGSDVVLDASGVGPLRNDPPISRLALLETLFDAGNMLQGERLRIRVPMTDATGPR